MLVPLVLCADVLTAETTVIINYGAFHINRLSRFGQLARKQYFNYGIEKSFRLELLSNDDNLAIFGGLWKQKVCIFV
jgi:hypothetical protein